jgi:phosphoserine phosphatase RsbU/P
MLGSVLATLGMLVLVVYFARKQRFERSFFWFGIFTALYGVRLTISTRLWSIAAEPFPDQLWFYLSSAITYLLPLAGTLFLQVLFPEWKGNLRWPARLLAIFAVGAFVLDVALREPTFAQPANNILVILLFVVLQVALYRRQGEPRLRPVKVGSFLFFVTVLVVNLWTLCNTRLPAQLVMLEPIGFTCFLAGLGVMVGSQLVHREEQMIEVQKELDVARRIQTSILPAAAPRHDQLAIASRYLSMTAVAGDFYEYLELGPGKVGFLIADVTGHGVPAALIASMVKIAISAQLPFAHDPAEVLAGMNRILCGKMQGQFVTAAYLYLDLEQALMRYAAAGHPPLFIIRDQESPEPIIENGLMLGILPSACYQAREAPLQPGTRFVLYTDGLLEAADSQYIFFGEERLRSALVEARALPPEQSVEFLIDRVRAWAGPRQQDDLTVLIIDVNRPVTTD